MNTAKTLHVLRLTILLLFISVFPSFGQQGSFYFSAGMNTSWYNNSTIHIYQPELGNDYDLWRVKGTHKTNSSFSPLLLNYRIGYYFNEWQDLGLEFSFDPVTYSIKDGSVVSENGTVNGMLGASTSQTFNRKTGSYYYFDGLNLFLVNLVKRWGIYRANTAVVSVDVLGKAGVGPVLPHFHSQLPVNPTDNAQLTWGGWNYGLEAAVRVTLYRYTYLEFAGKYDYATMDGMQVFEGTASQKLGTYEVIASLGFTFPTMRFNPLFHKEKRIITLLPWYQHIDELGATAAEKSEVVNGLDTAGSPGIPEFSDIVDQNAPKFNLDSLAAIDSYAAAERVRADSLADATKPKKRKRRHKGDVVDSVAAPAPMVDTSAAPPPVDTAAKPTPPPPPPPPDTVKAAEPPKAPEIKEETKQIIKEAIEGVNFESSKDIIQKSSYTVLDKVVKLMKDNPTYKLQINGHTDNHGSAAFNKTLSQKRSAAVKKYLVAHGVAGGRLKTAGYGGERPIATNDTEEGRLKNRRVEFIIE